MLVCHLQRLLPPHQTSHQCPFQVCLPSLPSLPSPTLLKTFSPMLSLLYSLFVLSIKMIHSPISFNSLSYILLPLIYTSRLYADSTLRWFAPKQVVACIHARIIPSSSFLLLFSPSLVLLFSCSLLFFSPNCISYFTFRLPSLQNQFKLVALVTEVN